MDDKDYKPYTSRRWTDIPQPIVIEHCEDDRTEEQKKKDAEEFNRFLEEGGYLEQIRKAKEKKNV